MPQIGGKSDEYGTTVGAYKGHCRKTYPLYKKGTSASLPVGARVRYKNGACAIKLKKGRMLQQLLDL